MICSRSSCFSKVMLAGYKEALVRPEAISRVYEMARKPIPGVPRSGLLTSPLEPAPISQLWPQWSDRRANLSLESATTYVARGDTHPTSFIHHPEFIPGTIEYLRGAMHGGPTDYCHVHALRAAHGHMMPRSTRLRSLLSPVGWHLVTRRAISASTRTFL